jgi:hypothetical protein
VDCDRDLPLDLVDALLRGNPDQLLAESEPLQLKERCAVARLDHPAGSLTIKRHEWGDRWRTARMLLRAPTARVSAALGVRLAEQGIATPRPRASVECAIGPFGYRSYLLTDFVEGTTLHRLVRSSTASPDVLADLARQVAEIWQRLIDLGVSHNDLKPENFVVDPTNKVWVIDFERPRLHRNAVGLPERHLADLTRFLHVRSWRTNPGAAETFRSELLKTSLGDWLGDSHLASRPGLRGSYSDEQLACGLSVVIMTHQSPDQRLAAAADDQVDPAVNSVRDIADEILVVSPSSSSAWHVIRRIDEPGQRAALNLTAQSGHRNLYHTGRPRHPWVLVLYAGDCVTPELARQLPEQIVERTDCDAFRIPIEVRKSGRRVVGAHSPAQAPIRLFHQERCSFSLRRGEVAIAADPARVGQLVDKLHHQQRVVAGGVIASDAGASIDAQPERAIRRAA